MRSSFGLRTAIAHALSSNSPFRHARRQAARRERADCLLQTPSPFLARTVCLALRRNATAHRLRGAAAAQLSPPIIPAPLARRRNPLTLAAFSTATPVASNGDSLFESAAVRTAATPRRYSFTRCASIHGPPPTSWGGHWASRPALPPAPQGTPAACRPQPGRCRRRDSCRGHSWWSPCSRCCC